MFSKHNLRLTTIFLTLVLLINGCAWIQDKPKQQTFNSSGLGMSCLTVMPDQLQTLFEGGYTFSAADQNEVDSIWKCLSSALETFANRTSGAQKGVYTQAELREFANLFLPKNRVLDGSLTNAIFKLKRAVLGGTDTELTKVEIANLITKLNEFGVMMKPFSGHLGTLVHSEGKTSTEKRAASESLNRFVLDLADLLGDSVNPVNWTDLISFVTELDHFTRTTAPTGLTAMKEQLPLFQYFKLLLVGGDENAIERAKWRPIFQAVSHFYNALFLTSNTSQLLEALSIEIESSEIEQRKAVEKISGLLKVLKNDPDLYSKRPVRILSDSWGKVLILNAFMFPRSQGSLALKPFLGSTALRKIAGYIIDQARTLKTGQIDSAVIQSLTDNLITLVEQAAIANSAEMGTIVPFSFASFKEYLPQVKPLLTDSVLYDQISQGTDTLKAAIPILIGKESDILTTKDLRNLIQKGSDLFQTWNRPLNTTRNMEESIAQSFEVLLRSPSFYTLQVSQIDTLLDSAQKLATLAQMKMPVSFTDISSFLHKGMAAKALLFNNSERSLTSYELRQVANLWDPFRKGIDPAKNLGDSLAEVSKVLKNSPFATVKIDSLLWVIDSFLPENRKIASYGLSLEQIGLVKSMLIGGSPTLIDRNEYTDIARIAGAIFKDVYPAYQSLPSDFKMGLNSKTMSIVEIALQSLIDSRANTTRGVISLVDLKKFLLSYLKGAGYAVTDKTMEGLLIGINHRVFQQKKTPKPATLSGVVTMDQLRPLLAMLDNLAEDFADDEAAFSGISNTRTLEQKTILKRLNRETTRTILTRLQPILRGGTGLPYFTASGKKNTQYYLEDLIYKDFIYQVINWVFPAYKIDEDSATGETAVRLAKDDLIDVLVDINDIATELRASYGTNSPIASARTRMQTINLFTQTGNGDDYIDLFETVEFLTMASSGKALLDDVLVKLAKNCGIQATKIEDIKGFSVDCLKSHFFENRFFVATYKEVAPQMIEEYISLNAEQKNSFQTSVMNASKAGWNEKTVFLLSDMETMVSVPYYAENIFEKMDKNFDGVLNFTEAMSGFPVFCREIKKAAGSSIKGSCETGEYPGQIEAVYGYLLFYGDAPRGIQAGDSIWRKMVEAKNFLLWVRTWNRMIRDPEVRDPAPPQLKRYDLIKIIANLSASIAPQPAPDSLESIGAL
jgi:hypothetical protein